MQFTDGGDRYGGGCAVGAMIDDPFKYVSRSLGGFIETFRNPKNPIFIIGQDLESEQLATVVGAIPSDRSIAFRSNDQTSVPSGVYRPNLVPRSAKPLISASLVECVEKKRGTDERLFGVGTNGKASDFLVG